MIGPLFDVRSALGTSRGLEDLLRLVSQLALPRLGQGVRGDPLLELPSKHEKEPSKGPPIDVGTEIFYSSEIDLKEGEEIQLKLLLGDKTQISPVYKP